MSLFIHKFFLALLVVGTMPFVVQLLKEERQPFILPFAGDSEVSYFKTVPFLFLCVVYAHTYMSPHLLSSVSKQYLRCTHSGPSPWSSAQAILFSGNDLALP